MLGRGSRSTEDMSSAADACILRAKLDRTVRRAVTQDVNSPFWTWNIRDRRLGAHHGVCTREAIREFRSSLKPAVREPRPTILGSS